MHFSELRSTIGDERWHSSVATSIYEHIFETAHIFSWAISLGTENIPPFFFTWKVWVWSRLLGRRYIHAPHIICSWLFSMPLPFNNRHQTVQNDPKRKKNIMITMCVRVIALHLVNCKWSCVLFISFGSSHTISHTKTCLSDERKFIVVVVYKHTRWKLVQRKWK